MKALHRTKVTCAQLVPRMQHNPHVICFRVFFSRAPREITWNFFLISLLPLLLQSPADTCPIQHLHTQENSACRLFNWVFLSSPSRSLHSRCRTRCVSDCTNLEPTFYVVAFPRRPPIRLAASEQKELKST